MANDTWATPPSVFDKLDDEFHFSFDVCAEHGTAKCLQYWTIEDDSLSKDWADIDGYSIWCNPPYSKIGPWVEKAIEAQRQGKLTVMLVMCDPSVKWFSLAISKCSEVRFVTNGRISFLKDGVAQGGNNKGSVIFVFDPHRVGTCHTSYIDRSVFY